MSSHLRQGLPKGLYPVGLPVKILKAILLFYKTTDLIFLKPTGKRPLGRPRRRWEDNIRMDLEEIDINAGNWVDSAQDRDYCRALVDETLNLRVP